MGKNMNMTDSTSTESALARVQRELRAIDRQLGVCQSNPAIDALVFGLSIFVIVASTAGLPLGILGVVAVARQSANRRKLLKKAAELERQNASIP